MDTPEGLRVSDEEREQAAREIREHYAAGRLNEEELSERLHRVYRAQTTSELQSVRTDLPVLPAAERAALARRRSELQRRLLQQSGGALVPFVICTVIWVAGGASGAFWPVWILLVALIPLVRNGWRLYGPAPELDRVEDELARRERGERPARDERRLERRERRRLER